MAIRCLFKSIFKVSAPLYLPTGEYLMNHCHATNADDDVSQKVLVIFARFVYIFHRHVCASYGYTNAFIVSAIQTIEVGGRNLPS